MSGVCATCGFPWGMDAIRHSAMCDDRRLATADEAVAEMMAQTDEQILASSTPEEIDAACKLHGSIMATSERAAIVAYLRNGGEYVRGLFVTWDSEMRAYAAAFADKIESEDHKPNSHWPQDALQRPCAHDWVERDSMFTNEYHTEVRCSICGVTGERDERDGNVTWPTT